MAIPKPPTPTPPIATKTPVPQSDPSQSQGPLPEYNLSQLLRRALVRPTTLKAHQVLQLQRTVGNRAVTQLLQAPATPSTPIQKGLLPPVSHLTRAPRIIQRVIPGLEAVRTVADIQDQWVADYIADVTDARTHLYDEDIIAYLDEARPDWHGQGQEEVRLRNTGGNHWDVTFISRAPARTVVVRTAPDGNCAIHAIHAILRPERFDADTEGFRAPAAMIGTVRGAIQDRIRQHEAEIKVRILLQIQRSDSSYGTGFGPALSARLRVREEAALKYVAENASPSAPRLPEDRTPADRIRVEMDTTVRFKRLLKEKVPAKTVEAMMLREKINPDAIRQFLALHTPVAASGASASSSGSGSPSASLPVVAASPSPSEVRPAEGVGALVAASGASADSAVSGLPSASLAVVVASPSPSEVRPAEGGSASLRASASAESPALPAKAPVDSVSIKRDEVRQRVLALERDLMDLVDFEAHERQFLIDMRTALEIHHQPKIEALRQAKARVVKAKADGTDVGVAEAEVARLTKEFEPLNTEVAARLKRFVAVSQARIARHQEQLPELITEKRKEWMSLMAELVGTHVPGGDKSWSGLVTRHDAMPGGYGRVPTAEDARIAHRQVEGLHGHGGWNRTGLVSEGLTNPSMAGLTSLSEILARANAIRATKKMLAIPADKLDLAFVEHHGATIMMDRVIRGAYPDLMAMPLTLHKRVVALMEEATKAKQEPDEYIRAQCMKMVPEPSVKAKTKTPGAVSTRRTQARAGRNNRSKPAVKLVPKWTDLPLWNAYQQVKEGTAGGKPGAYVDVLSAATHGAVRFPDSRLGHLYHLDQGEKAMKAGAVSGYRVSTVMDLSFKKTDDLDTVTVDANTVSARLSDAIVERLSQIEVDERPIRIIWAGCRSEQWRKDFSDKEFLAWIRQAAASRQKRMG